MSRVDIICISRYFEQIKEILLSESFPALNTDNRESLEAIPAESVEKMLTSYKDMLDEIYEDLTVRKEC